MPEHLFWLTLTTACIVWYSTITVYVAVRGVLDIKGMLSRLAENGQKPDA
ncbi:MAG: hypothetical protein K1Y02_02600 [Candidatus Hydrogenedentes bacterium]|nr:hypothetical protein [Candidatus Hydrogenedentota bacterium]